MSTAILSPKEFSPADLDNYLAKGWRPYGQQIYTADYIQLQLGEVYSVLPTRLDLTKHKWRKGQRKLLSKLKKSFQFCVRPVKLTDEHIQINNKYKVLFPSKAVDDLNIHLSHEGIQIFDTHEVCIYDNGKLVAFSFFDLGKESTYSKVGIYDTDYHRYSLGIFSMYLEIEWCMEQGLKYYYPGYISPETPLFDYKMKIGELDFWFLQKKTWLPLKPSDKLLYSPLKTVHQKTKIIFDALQLKEIQAKIYDYCFFEMPLIYPRPKSYLDTPRLIVLHFPNERHCLLVRYKIEYDTFECWKAICEHKVSFNQPANRHTPIFQYVLKLDQPIVQTNQIGLFVETIKKNLTHTKQKLYPPTRL